MGRSSYISRLSSNNNISTESCTKYDMKSCKSPKISPIGPSRKSDTLYSKNITKIAMIKNPIGIIKNSEKRPIENSSMNKNSNNENDSYIKQHHYINAEKNFI